jgi:ABC-type amino acid transport substrate-binding protein
MVVPAILAGFAVAGWAGESALEKINRTGVFTVGTRTASPPFGYINKQNEWVGFSVDLAGLIHRDGWTRTPTTASGSGG